MADTKPQALAVANFLRHRPELKQRPGIAVNYNDKISEIYRVKRAVRALVSDDYKAARSKNMLLPPVNSPQDALKVFALLPTHRLSMRVEKLKPHSMVIPASKVPKNGSPVMMVSPAQQLIADNEYYIWLYEPVQATSYLYASLVIIGILALCLFPLWPHFMRRGAWFLSMGAMGFLVFLFALAIIRLVLFSVIYLIAGKRFWLLPNLFADVGFFASFVPLYQIDDTKPAKEKRHHKSE
ncbi:hypothetical protein CANCADRAFT_447 [Tortispora caseinolytica NRRL Y-17796]|uniref:Translocation protein SEC62 n=1 Tax=Tortispora caseinolytica NRRL Y-17796 TaxID=767744 RepID=A0A1E4TJK9_9ASCO|nr:hypothetical protein CANCADRAFT_447 [Tortispora caseinolytica NRRL Y-17796]